MPTAKYGVYLPPFGPLGDPEALVEIAVRAEAAGWDGIFLWDHLVTDMPPIADTWTMLGAIAQATDRLAIGSSVTPITRRRPWVVARQASTVSRLAGGRLIFGAGLGTDETGDFSRFGEVPETAGERAERFVEALGVIRRMWSGAEVRHDGPRYQVRLEASEPEPYPIPVWLASSTGAASVIRRAAACDGIFPNPDDHRPSADEIRALLAELGAAGLPSDRPFDVAVRGNASPAWGEELDVDVAGLINAGMTWWMESLIHFDPLDLSLEVVDAGPPRP